jgi:hypothetical protein
VLSVLCGVAILLAGGLWLLQASRAADQVKPALVVGQSATIGGDSYELVSAVRGSDNVLVVEFNTSTSKAAQALSDDARVIGRGAQPIKANKAESTLATPEGPSSTRLTFALKPEDTDLFVAIRRQGGANATWSLAAVVAVTTTTAG